MKIIWIIIGASALALSGCKKVLTPDPENPRTVEQMYGDPAYAQGFLMNAYRTIPGYYDNSEFATDDAVSNNRNQAYLQLATGSWTASNNPTSVWDGTYGSIQYLNLFLNNVDSVAFALDPEAAKLFNMRMRGEAFGLRALHMYFLLRSHAGFAEDGQLMGVPIITNLLTVDSNANKPRATFDACVKQIYKDLDSAEFNLPLEYKDAGTVAQIPQPFAAVTQKTAVYNRVMGQYSMQLFNGLIAKSVRTRVALLAASPAFQHGSNPVTWADAANYAAAIITYKGGVAQLPTNGWTFYENAEIDNLSGGNNPPEIIWRENRQTNNSDQEAQHFPPTLFGNGLMNPTQNLVDAFPMANGFPVGHASSNFDPANPYAGRDPRLAKYIIVNGSTAGASNQVILTGSASGTDDGINVRPTSTRTGYYMRKRLRMNVNRNPASITGRNRYTPRIRYTEMYLAYAEAANEAWGPTGTGAHSFSAFDVIKRIRTRAGVGTTNGDAYLEECKGDKNKMRELIRNERRLELSFESFRFWDLRRWKANLNEAAKGLDVNGTTYSPINVENRAFGDYMYYGPIPLLETLKFSNLVQNRGWK